MDAGVQGMRKDLQAVHQPGSGTVEIVMAVDHVDPLMAHGRQVGPAGLSLQDAHVFQGALDAEPA